jgi:hypothetical protein
VGAAAQPPHPCTTAATLGENSSHNPPQSNPLQCATGSCRSGVVAVGITRREGDHLRGAFVVKPPAVAFHDSAPPLHCRHPAVAARLEGIAQPGAICLSEDAYRQVRARLDLEVNDLGQKELKNIVEPNVRRLPLVGDA